MRSSRWFLFTMMGLGLVVVIGCGPADRGTPPVTAIDAPTIDQAPPPADACVGRECQVAPCEKMGRPATSISGIVHMPNGTLPLYGVTVYVPNTDPGPLTDGVECAKCNDQLPGKAVAKAFTTESGHFQVQNVPSGTDIPLVVTIGGWRRQLTIPLVEDCKDHTVDPLLTRLPKNQTEGDIPKIAMVTGGCDALECLLRKIGIDDAEFTSDAGTGRIHLYNSNGTDSVGATTLSPASSLWGNLDKLKQYDISMFSCECSQQAFDKPQAMMNNIKAYADMGGRVFLSHYHNVWIVGEVGNPGHAPPVWPQVATCNADGFGDLTARIDTTHNPRGLSFQLWMEYVMGSPSPGVIPIVDGRQTCTAIDHTKAQRWVYIPGGTEIPQNFQFTTPNELPENGRCGKVVFSDMHVANGSFSTPGVPFPGSCSSAPMSPQEKALAFMFFDIAACVGVIE